MRRGVLRDLTAAEKRDVLARAAYHILHDAESKLEQPRTLRQTIAAALSDQGFWHMGVGGHREMDVTIEVQRALGLVRGVASVDTWAAGKSSEQIFDAVQTTIAHLQ